MANYKKSLELVKEHLESTETVKASVFGMYEGKLMGNDISRNGIFVATEKRVVFFAKKLLGYDLETFPFRNISSVEQSKGLMGHKITIHASGNNANMKWIQQGDVPQFIQFINQNIGQSAQAIPQVVNVETDIPSQIKKLAELKDQGILTEDEFTSKKSELLAKM